MELFDLVQLVFIIAGFTFFWAFDRSFKHPTKTTPRLNYFSYFLHSQKPDTPDTKPVPITLDRAIELISHQPVQKKLQDNFIGFTNPKGETVQFIRKTGATWLVDAPRYDHRHRFTHSIGNDQITPGQVVAILEAFFTNQDWTGVVTLH